MKYIRFENGFVIFTDNLSHQNIEFNLHGMAGKAISAGMVEFVGDRSHCHGNSVTLQLESAPEDTKLLQAQIDY